MLIGGERIDYSYKDFNNNEPLKKNSNRISKIDFLIEEIIPKCAIIAFPIIITIYCIFYFIK